ncbi:MAG: CPBP family intramembrane glutamic endopeptidase [Propionicimonas sp.]|nr:CPBP family intramembrane glutamic endopeptidase [Propionicimonas sp.]
MPLLRRLRSGLDRLAVAQPPAGVPYSEVLAGADGAQGPRWRSLAVGVIGAALGIVLFLVVTPAVELGVLGIGWAVAGQPGSFTEYYRAGHAFQTPLGMVAAHLGLAMLIPITVALLVGVHRVHPRWLHSVQPGFRWRYGLVAFGVACVVLNGVMLVSQPATLGALRPQPGFWGFLVAILLTSPLQAAAEEYFFRGYLMQALQPGLRSPWFGVVASALVFALFHGTQNLPLFLDRFGFGLLAGVLVVRTGGLEAGIAAHVANNIFAFTWAGLTSTIATVRATQVIGWVEAAWDLAGFALYALAAVWVGRRMHLATTTPGVRQVG